MYESPTLDTADGFRDSPSKVLDCDCKQHEFSVEKSNREKLEDGEECRRTVSSDDVEHSNGIGKNDKICEDYKQEIESSNRVLILLSLCSFCCPFLC